MTVSAQERGLHYAPTHQSVFFAAALGAFAIGAAVCNGATPPQEAKAPIWPTKEWPVSTPEEEGMDSKELVKLVDSGILSFDSLLVARHGKIVVEAYYAPYAAGIPHATNSGTKAVVSTLAAIAYKEGLLDSPNHRVLQFFGSHSVAGNSWNQRRQGKLAGR